MRIGLTIFANDLSIDLATLARAADERGYASIWFPEHTHIPVSRETPAPTGDDELAEEYRRTLDPFIAMATVTAVSERLHVGTGVALVAQHDPIVLAKTIATLDHVSGGRVTLGVGFGWNKEEMADHGIDYRTRRAVAREKVLAMQALWRDDVASFDGEHVSFSPSWSWPKPVQRPRVRTLVGGAAGPIMFAHIAEYGDGWMPIGGAGIRAALPPLQEAWAAAGRDGEPAVLPFGVLPDPGKLEYYAGLGIDEAILRLPAADEATVMKVLDSFTPYVAQYNG
jgi:probable F420-dependent oxidoreductase